MNYLTLLPSEVLFSVFKNANPMALTRLCQTSSLYRNICSEEYDYLWKTLLFELIHPLYNYVNIEEFNDLNKTKFGNWCDVYEYFYKLELSLELSNESDLIRASQNGNLEEVKCYISHEGNIHKLNTALQWSAEYGHLNIVMYLVDQNADIHAEDEGALRLAASNGHLDVLKYLIGQGADVRARHDQTLQLAAMYGHLDVVEYLLSQGVSINTLNSALEQATNNGHLDVIEYIVNEKFPDYTT